MDLFRAAFVFLIVSFLGVAVNAEPVCKPTVKLNTLNYPGVEAIPPTNNLVLPTGKSIEAEGQKLLIKGHLVDNHCVPLKEAIVELWQVDPYGHYTLLQMDDAVTPKPVFAGAGRAVTDVDGNFNFTTGFPGVVTYQIWESYKVKVGDKIETRRRAVTIRRAPHLNLLVKADGFQPFSTTLFFDGDRRNAEDVVFKKLSEGERASVTLTMTPVDAEQVVASKEIVLIGQAPYRGY